MPMDSRTTQQTADLIINSLYIALGHANDSHLKDHAVVINQGQIVAIGPQAQIAQQYRATEVHTFSEHLLTPGFINSHAHSAMTLFRGFADDLPLMEALSHHIWPAETKWVTPEFIQSGGKLAIAEMLLSGTTSVTDMYFFPEIFGELASDCGMKAQLATPILEFPNAWSQNSEQAIHKTLDLIKHFKNNPLIEIGFGPHAPYTVADHSLKSIADLAKQEAVFVQMHVHETAQEITDALADSGIRPLERLQSTGILDTRFQAVHMTQISDRDLAVLKESPVMVVHCPESNLKLASGFCPVTKLQAIGLDVCIGTDSAFSNNNLDCLSDLRTAALLAKAVAEDAAALNCHATLQMATYTPGKQLQKGLKTGTLAQGYAADIVSWRLNDLNTQPVYEPIAQLIYAANSRQVDSVWVAGKQQVKSGKLCHLDKEEIIAQAQVWRDKIQQGS